GVVACLLLLMSGIRFGSPLSGWSRGRRSPLEHVEALALAYRAAGGGRAAADRLVRGAARRAGVEGRSLEQWAGRAGGHGAALRARRALDVDPPDLVALSGALDELTSQQVIHDGRKHDPSR
ncbi:MAG: hypothetical protein OEZ37_13335, partial [Gemmatimonadota bacterium]|nr:hypothetical protein [Gemmatimonadota bacterium]